MSNIKSADKCGLHVMFNELIIIFTLVLVNLIDGNNTEEGSVFDP